MKLPVFLVMAFLVLLTPAIAADPTGHWKGKFDTQDGSHELTFNMTADGAHLKGTVSGLPNKELEITDGKVDGSTITFSVTSEWEGNPVKLVYKGEVGSDEIKFTMGTENGEWSTEFAAKKMS